MRVPDRRDGTAPRPAAGATRVDRPRAGECTQQVDRHQDRAREEQHAAERAAAGSTAPSHAITSTKL